MLTSHGYILMYMLKTRSVTKTSISQESHFLYILETHKRDILHVCSPCMLIIIFYFIYETKIVKNTLKIQKYFKVEEKYLGNMLEK